MFKFVWLLGAPVGMARQKLKAMFKCVLVDGVWDQGVLGFAGFDQEKVNKVQRITENISKFET